MSIATTSSAGARSPARYLPYLAIILAMIAVLLLALGPIGWRAGWWHFRFGLLTLMPWAAYCGVAALIVAAVALLFGRSRIEWRGVALAVLAFGVGGLIAYVPWHYDQIRKTVPRIHDITTDPDNPPAFVAAAQVRTAEGANPTAYGGAKVAQQQRQAYPDIAPLIVKSAPGAAFDQALDAARRMGWSIVAADKAAGRIEATDRSRWFGFTDDIVIRLTATHGGSRVDLRSSSRLGRSDFGVNAARVRGYLAALRASTAGQG